jgi:tetrapyrrole methylase family protein/MazG family protein
MSIFEIAQEQSQHAASFGFDWANEHDVMFKVLEEVEELKVAVDSLDRKEIRHEMGDVLLALVSLSRHSNISIEQAFHDAIERFQHRWEQMEDIAKAEGIALESQSPNEWERLWENAKAKLDGRA